MTNEPTGEESVLVEDFIPGREFALEGVVTADRKVRADVFSRLAELYRYDLGEPAPPPRTPVLLPAPQIVADANAAYTPIPLQSLAEQQAADWDRLQDALIAASFWARDADGVDWPINGDEQRTIAAIIASRGLDGSDRDQHVYVPRQAGAQRGGGEHHDRGV